MSQIEETSLKAQFVIQGVVMGVVKIHVCTGNTVIQCVQSSIVYSTNNFNRISVGM